MSTNDELLNLKELHEAGVLSDEEFQAGQKKVLQGGVSPVPSPPPPPPQVPQPAAPAAQAPMPPPPPPPPPPQVPQPAAPAAQAPMPPTYLAQAILVTLFCFLPLGIVAIIKASRVSSVYHSRGYAEALRVSESAKLFCRLAFYGFFLLFVGYAVVVIMRLSAL